MDVFKLHKRLIADYESYITSFINIRDERMTQYVKDALGKGLLWPEPLIQLSPAFEYAESIDELVDSDVLHKACKNIFRKDKDRKPPGESIRLYRHQATAITAAAGGHNYVLTTGTGSGKSLAYFIPIIDRLLKEGPGQGIKAIIVYPVNALANSQCEALEQYLNFGYPPGVEKVRFARYTGQESDEQRNAVKADPPDILITNYVMLELLLTRSTDRELINQAKELRFLVLDELHTYRGRQGADVAMLVRRVRNRVGCDDFQCIGTSATLAGGGSYEEQQKQIAETASLLFGAEIKPEHVIGETLKRATKEENLQDQDFIKRLQDRVLDNGKKPPLLYEAFTTDPLSCWLETTLGVRKEPGCDRLIRQSPRSIKGEDGAAEELSKLTGAPEERCIEVIQETLLGGYLCQPNEQGFKPFAFRVHQFISRGGSIYTTLEPEDERYLTVQAQQYVPGDRSRVLFPVVYCRECGQEYYKVIKRDAAPGEPVIIPWSTDEEAFSSDDSQTGYLFFNSEFPWPDGPGQLDRLPENWLEEYKGDLRVKYHYKKHLPQKMKLNRDGSRDENGIDCHFIPAPFRFCLNCKISYFRQRTEFAKLSSLASEGRSTATTILSLSAITNLRREKELSEIARKLLSFTDNRQDASLQAGHFNDFVETGLMRAAIYRAVAAAGEQGLAHDDLAIRVFEALNLPLEQYAANPEVRFQALEDTKKALRQVLGYRLYRDLRRGWRVTAPNLEQCGLLEIQYPSLDDLCSREEIWENYHGALSGASPAARKKTAAVLLDHLRRELAIKVDYLRPDFLERIVQNSNQWLIAPWAIDEDEIPEPARILFPCSEPKKKSKSQRYHVYLSERSGFGYYLLRQNTFESNNERLHLSDGEQIISDLLDALKKGGLVEEVQQPGKGKKDEFPGVPGYQLLAAAMRWKPGSGELVFLDPIRFPQQPAEGSRTNRFFVEFYRSGAEKMLGIEAREHTAQVRAENREEREKLFKEGKLPILYCSPTMELGVDIKDLNVVNMRNIPPTPANYAQRSGRAGRSGQPALIFSYCSVGNPHDQYFFKRPQAMVSGAVKTPCIDLANEDLIRSHVQAVWLAETGLELGSTLKDILDLSGDDPSLELQELVAVAIGDKEKKMRAFHRAQDILAGMKEYLEGADWYTPGWLETVIENVDEVFDSTCSRWRDLYRSAWNQYNIQSRLAVDASRSKREKDRANGLAKEARSQLQLLTDIKEAVFSDFYSYRYFAGEGFLPGYSFPRLPLSAYIPGRKVKSRDEYLSRPRFLAISEFGPGATIYHEGSRYVISKVILPVSAEGELTTRSAKCCPRCGYLHPIKDSAAIDLCEVCGAELDLPFTDLFQLQNVSTMRRDRINSDEEERLRLGYDIKTVFRFSRREGVPLYRTAEVMLGDILLARMKYASAAVIWRINMGRKSQAGKGQFGFELDTETGWWTPGDKEEEETDEDIVIEEPFSRSRKRVIPFVEDRRNCLLFSLENGLEAAAAASLQAALKRAIQLEFQLEESELAVEPLPERNNRKHLLFYEAAEGGAGVLRLLIQDAEALQRAARTALELCHFDAQTGAEAGDGVCEAACYDCLMSYYNQMDHRLLDRQAIKNILLDLAKAQVRVSPAPLARAEHIERLLRLAGSELEKEWLHFLEKKCYNLPTEAQKLVESCRTRPDFWYNIENRKAAVYIDGPVHLYPQRQERDRLQEECLEDSGIRVIRFGSQDDWAGIIARYPDIFGPHKSAK